MTRAEATAFVRRCLDEENYLVRDHFEARMTQRGLFWPDVLAVIEAPTGVRTDGRDEYGRERWFFRGGTTGAIEVELLCVYEGDPVDTVLFWTIYWED